MRQYNSSPFFVLFFLFLGLITSSCGGGGSTASPPPPPPPPSTPSPDFSLSLTTPGAAQQGGAGSIFNVSVTALAGFSGAVTITVEGLPSSITATQTGQSITPGQNLGVTLFASLSAPTGNTAVTVRGVSGNLNHTATIPLSVTAGAAFRISLSQANLTMRPGEVVNTTVTISPGSGNVTSAMLNISSPPGAQGQGLGVGFVPGIAQVTTTQPANIQVSASPFAESKTLTYEITATSGSDTSVTVLQVNLNNPFPVSNSLPRTTFVRTDYGVTYAVYDPVRRLIFATVHDLNRVEVLDPDGRRRGVVNIPRPFGIDQAPDGRIIVGTQTSAFYVVDPDSLEVVDRVAMPHHYTVSSGSPFGPRPVFVKTASNGKALIISNQGNTTGRELWKWDMVNGTFTQLLVAGASFEIMVRSQDYSTILLGSSHSAGGYLGLYDGQTDTLGPAVPFSGTLLDIAVNRNGSLFSVGNTVYDRSLNVVRTGILSGA